MSGPGRSFQGRKRLITDSLDDGDDGKQGIPGFHHTDTSNTSRHGPCSVPRLIVSVVAASPAGFADQDQPGPQQGHVPEAIAVPVAYMPTPSRSVCEVRSFSAKSAPDPESLISSPHLQNPRVDHGKKSEGLYNRAFSAKLAGARVPGQHAAGIPVLPESTFLMSPHSPDSANSKVPVSATQEPETSIPGTMPQGIYPPIPDTVALLSCEVSSGVSGLANRTEGTEQGSVNPEVPESSTLQAPASPGVPFHAGIEPRRNRSPVPRLVPGWDDDELDPEEYGPIVFKDGVFRIEDEPEGGEVRVDPVLKALIDSILV